MTKIKRKRMKGNNGRRHREQRERILTIGATAASCIFIFFCVIPYLGSGKDRKNGRPGTRGMSQKKLESFHPGDHLPAVAPKEELKAKKRRNNAATGETGRGGRRRDGLLPMRKALEDPTFDPVATQQARDILSASTNLVDVDMGPHASIEDESYGGVIAEFCPLDFSAQKDNPPELPMFRDVVGHSGCDEKRSDIIRVDLKEAVDLAREFDGDNNDGNLPTVLDLKGVVFHESRCGSTLAANSMMALNPEKHRVYSESSPPIAALRGCGEDYSDCSLEASANLLKDVIYMMGRSDDPKEENLFFKFQSVTTRTMRSFRMAFPTTPWIFLYREPVEVMMSQLDVPKMSKANCVKSRNSSPMVRDVIRRSDYEASDFLDEEFCAIHLATLCSSAFENLEDSDGLGMAVNYHPELVHDFLDTIFPKHFHTPVDKAGRDRVLKISGTYSKNRGRHEEGGYKPDSEAKERNASEEIKDAAKLFLEPVYKQLQKSEYNIMPQSADGYDDDEEDEV
mmetsp:Transcript_24297/g.52504  ORF Transcript_24297/g.52504 Transcript_24297/m.52504 type:complete len:510 (+) Transcript_24297:175-1704(+)